MATYPLGLVGTAGTSGSSGKDGTGTSGTSGQSGTSGTSGTSGQSTGSSGTSGTAGTSGLTGTAGTAGTSGLTGTSGVNATMSVTSAEFVSVQTQVSLLISAPVTLTTTGAVIIPVARRVLAATATPTANDTLQNVTGLSVSVTNGGIYKVESNIGLNRAAVANVNGYGLTFPAVTSFRGQMYTNQSGVQGFPTVTTIGRWAYIGDNASGSVLISTVSMNILSVVVQVRGIIDAAADGVIQMQIKAPNGAGVTVLAGSYIEVYRIY